MPRARALALLAVVALASGCDPEADPDGFGRRSPEPGITGTICTPNRNFPVFGAEISVYVDADGDEVRDDDTVVGTGTSAVDGTFFVQDVPSGTYLGEVRKGHKSFVFPFAATGGVQQRVGSQCFPVELPRVAVIEGECDAPQALLAARGWSPTVLSAGESGWAEALTNVNALNAYDVLVAPCGMPSTWLPQRPTVTQVLNFWLADGRSLYVSGDAFPLLEVVSADAVDFLGDDDDPAAPGVGFGATVQASAVDAALVEIFGDDPVEVLYAEDGWTMATGVGDGVDVLLRGDVQSLSAEFVSGAPLAASFQHAGGGLIVYSTFGSGDNATDDMTAVLEELLTSL